MVDAEREPLFAGLLSTVPVPLCGGLPVLTPELRWAPGVDVHLLGAYAALELGPGALNLAGGRVVAPRPLLQGQPVPGPACRLRCRNCSRLLLAAPNPLLAAAPRRQDGGRPAGGDVEAAGAAGRGGGRMAAPPAAQRAAGQGGARGEGRMIPARSGRHAYQAAGWKRLLGRRRQVYGVRLQGAAWIGLIAQLMVPSLALMLSHPASGLASTCAACALWPTPPGAAPTAHRPSCTCR
jgi:hypothetical protein